MECVFCKIINNEIPSKKVYEDDNVLALIPLEEVSKGHTLLIPKEHFENMFDVNEETFLYFSKILKKLANQIVIDNNATGLNILNANGKGAQQSVFHLHYHLVPRYPNDGLDMWIKQNL